MTASEFPYTLCIETMPRYLTEQDIADFRAELCKVATERFARFGYEGVTMRQLAEALGCSPKTPYRYFKDKADILATVRAQAFAKFADALETAVTSAPAIRLERGRPSARPTSRFAHRRTRMPIASCSRSMQPIDDSHPELGPQGAACGAPTSRAGRGDGQGGIDRRRSRRCSAGRCGRPPRPGDAAAGRHAETCVPTTGRWPSSTAR